MKLCAHNTEREIGVELRYGYNDGRWIRLGYFKCDMPYRSVRRCWSSYYLGDDCLIKRMIRVLRLQIEIYIPWRKT